MTEETEKEMFERMWWKTVQQFDLMKRNGIDPTEHPHELLEAIRKLLLEIQHLEEDVSNMYRRGAL